MEKVIAFLKRLHPLSPPLEAALRNELHFSRKRKNEFLLLEGDVCRYAWYLQKGLVRCYYNRDEREVTTWFMEEDNIIVLFKSLFGQKKSQYNVQALEDSELYSIRIEDIQYLLDTYPDAGHIRTIIADRYNDLKDIHIRATNHLSPANRYAYFLKHFPQLPNRIKLEHIASYLDISKSSIARARRRKL